MEQYIYDVIGMIGAFLILASYFLLQNKKILGNSISYNLLNLVGALCILASLLVNWNLTGFIIEVCWASISIFGIVKTLRQRK